MGRSRGRSDSATPPIKPELRKRTIPVHNEEKHCKFEQRNEKGQCECRLLQLGGQAVAIATYHGQLEWATSVAHHILRRYWPEHHPLETHLPLQIRHWINKVRKKAGEGNGAPEKSPQLVIDQPLGRLVVRSVPNGTCVALLFEESMFDLPVERLMTLGLTAREAEVLRWLIQGKSIPEIAAILRNSPRTVSKLLTRTYRQLGVENRHAAVATALEAMLAYKDNLASTMRHARD